MIDSKTLWAISERLKTAKNNQADFGGMKLVLCGDPRQLPPVGGKKLWAPIHKKDSPPTVARLLLYSNFRTVCELTVNQRQGENSYFGNLCNRIAEGQMTESDYNNLSSINR